MKLTIVSSEPLNLQVPFTEGQHFALYTDLFSSNSRDRSATKGTCNKFLSAFKKKFDNHFDDSILDIDFQVKKKGKGPYSEKTEVFSSTIIVQGEILRAVQEVLGYGDKNNSLELQITLQCRNTYTGQPFGFTPHGFRPADSEKEVTIQGFLPLVNAAGSTDHSVYKKGNAELPMLTHVANHQWCISVAVKNVSYISLDGLLPYCSQENRKRFMEKEKFADFKIFVEGKEVLCNKIFLASMSPVLSTMLESGYIEGKNSEMSIEGFSYEGVNALLKFMYYLDVSDAMKSSKVALELYQAADLYEISVLGRVIGFILLEKPNEWYDVNVALTLLQLVQKLKTGDVDQKKKIKEKMFKVLSLNIDNLSKSKLLEELYPNEDGRESFKALLEIYRS